LRTIDLFAGCGGIRAGMESAGFSTVFANDIEPKAKITYDLNSDCPMTVGDINEIPIDSLPDFDCLTGGFPCQPFSQSGKRLGFDDMRGTLVFRIAEIIRAKRPKTFLLENVKGLVGHDGGRTLETILDVFQNTLGYEVHHKVLNTLDYGIPQNRQRIFIVGFDKTTDFEFPKPISLQFTVQDLLEDEVDERFYIREDHKHYKAISAGVTDPTKVYQWRWSYIRENKRNVAPTLLASYMQPTLIKTSKGIRGITPREAFNLQGFSKEFILPDLPDKVLMHQAGNSVSVPVINQIAQKMRGQLIH
jgi:DNA (cytosine-5)-methyltransferase 1